MSKLTNYYFHLGGILLKSPEEIQHSLLTMIYPTLIDKNSIKLSKKINGSVLDAAIDGKLPLVFSKLLDDTKSYDLFKELVVMNTKVVALHPKWGMEMLSSDAINILICHFNPKNCIFTSNKRYCSNNVDARYDYMVNILMELIILLLELFEKSSEGSSHKGKLLKDSTEALHAAIMYYLPVKFDKYRKIRNEITHLTIILMEKFSLPIIGQSYFAKDMLQLSILTEQRDVNQEQLFGFQFTANNLDLEFKKSLIHSSIYFSQLPVISKVVKDIKFFHGLFEIIYPPGNQPVILWSAAQWKDIEEAVLSVLPIIIPSFPTEFVTLDIGKKLIEILQFNAEKKEYDVLLQCIRTLAATREDKTGDILNNLLENNAIPFVENLTFKFLEQQTPTLIEQRIALHAIIFLHCLVLGKKKNFREHGIYMFNLSSRLITNYLKCENDPYQHVCHLTIMLTDILRECLQRCESLKTRFLDEKGIFLLLDLVEVAPFLTKVVTLGLLADLMVEGNCVPQMLLWKGNVAHGGRSFSQNQRIQELQSYSKCKHKHWLLPLLMNIWRMEEEKLQVLRQPHQVIKDTQASLMGRDHRVWLTSREKESGDSFSIAELCGSGRTKIYCIISLLKFHWQYKAAKLIPTFQEYANCLDADDQTMLKLVENYPFLKKGEKWLETKVLSTRDDTTVDILCQRSIEWTERVLKEQEQLQTKGTRTELERERSSYKYIRSAHLAPELEKKRQLLFEARTSNKSFLAHAKQQQEMEINSSLKFPERSRKYRTYTTRPKTTVFAANFTLNE